MILIAAPAGTGKTTLLASWHADPSERCPFAWLSVCDRDNDPVRFWTHVLMAIRTVAPAFAPEVDALLLSPGADLTERAIPMLVNARSTLLDTWR